MLEASVIAEIEEAAGRPGKREAMMDRLTSFGCGGPASLLVQVEEPAELSRVLSVLGDRSIPWCVIGRGTNLLVADEGYPGAVIMLSGELKSCRVEGNVLIAGAGALLLRAAGLAAENGLSGLEPLSQIPGTVGGAVAMNAGAFGSQIGDLVEWVEVCVPGGCHRMDRGSLAFGYRSSNIPGGAVVTGAAIALETGGTREIREAMSSVRRQREASQPRGERTFGSVFKNPRCESAGRLLDSAGAKGLASGGAAVSRTHANFIVNRGKATAADVVDLMNRCRRMVFDRTGIRLEPEVRFLGDIGLEEL